MRTILTIFLFAVTNLLLAQSNEPIYEILSYRIFVNNQSTDYMSATGTIEITNTYKNLKITSEFLNDEYRLVRNDGTENIEDWKWDKGEVWSCISGNDIREVQLTFLNDSKGETPSALHIDNLNPLMKSYIILYRIK